jgi:hypothetical protein
MPTYLNLVPSWGDSRQGLPFFSGAGRLLGKGIDEVS